MTEKQIAAREKELQSYLKMHPRLNLEFKALMSRLFREHSIDVTAETLSRLTLSLDVTGADPDSNEWTSSAHRAEEASPAVSDNGESDFDELEEPANLVEQNSEPEPDKLL